MAARPVLRTAVRAVRVLPQSGPSRSCSSSRHVRLFSTTPRSFKSPSDHATSTSSSTDRTTHFGFEDGISEAEKTERVAGVFHSVAESYDRMNDLMSFGVHRLWKDHFVSSLNPGSSSSIPPKPQHILDIAGGTGDIAFRMLHNAHTIHRNTSVHVTISDINPSMLAVGKQRSLSLPPSQQSALSFLPADATALPASILPNSIDLYTVAFGIRNFANIPLALREAYRVLKPGGVFACLEFSKVENPVLDAVYKRWSFSGIPLIGQLVAGDRDSYQYLVESIERFPSQGEFRDMIVDAGFVVGGDGYENLTGGVAAIHKGMKPLDG
ncbi:ubiE/COQ5 methyltransferase family-domain-containing protein [Pseudomassariella vexata]|uniref:2-methoxy-6-polyprenyl-1,4-benzoquinol methylase, mitochondrial n=1 Tax=Pseudomassariella vexata TaxID=1141098 RepID=A0A1Y2DQ10_9PEZI|nr:ubiE/COQ5 methyltransferase family-domain-containing protein [Pseudomassariella vexata]ORY61297.1 ubiE/COQ5 methyltransferase family-domain-containing protein [Pseudomassariella vexata]